VKGKSNKAKNLQSSIFNLHSKYSFDIYNIPAIAKEVYDVSGAGDTVISTLTLGLSAGGSFIESAYLATYAASVVVSKTGVVAIDKDELVQTIKASKEESRKLE
jgi:D-beta-D-heptose 7-phosphate kinase/D-beta-D-heptose 1-phosphate adenosyltransferase